MTDLVRLKDVCEITMGQAPPGSSYNDLGDGVGLISGASGLGEVNPKPSKWTTSPSRLSREGDIVLCIRATIGDRNWSNGEYCLGRGVAGLRADPQAMRQQYLWHLIGSKERHLLGQARGATFKQIKKDDLESLEFSLPPLDEQRRIAAILDKADEIRRKRQQAIELADEFLGSVFLDMFGDPVTNPKGWEIVELGRKLDFVTSGSRGWAKYYVDSGKRFIRSYDVGMNELRNDDIVFVEPPESAEADRTRVLRGDVLLTITGSRIGRAAPVLELQDDAHISQHVAILRPTEEIDPVYLSTFLTLESGGQRQIKKLQYGQTKPGLNLDNLRGFEVPLPPKEIQEMFREIRDRSVITRSKLSAAKDTDEALAGSLTAELIGTG